MGIGRITTYSLVVTLIMSFGFAIEAAAKSKRKKRIVQITLAPKKPTVKKKRRTKRQKPRLVKDKRSQSVEIEPLQKSQKLSNLGIKKIWKKKKVKRKRRLAGQSKKRRAYKEKQEEETQIQDRDLNLILEKYERFL